MNLAEYLFMFLVFPGLLFSGAAGLVIGWVDRKVTAMLQWRVGPPWYQNFLDTAKLLLYKETLIPKGIARGYFLGMPLLALSAATLASTVLLSANGSTRAGFLGDVIVVVYLLMMPPIALMLGAFSSANTLATVGASREIKLMLSYELPFLLALSVPIVKSGYALKLGDIINYQAANGAVIGSPSGVLSFLAMIFCIQAKLGFVPFDMPEAETELMAGVYIEYSGKALGFFKLAKSIMIFALPVLIVTLYCGGVGSGGVVDIMKGALEYIAIVFIMILIKNTNPRVRIDHAMKFFWGPVAFLAALSCVLAVMGY
ncbi:MAG: NADH-quinone oxidoreductase subunit H [Candidatus Omnitrophica bacterium]|nr:NADH-quinone oxidoreductase subunit H [Candidatus Omnitrophota bacterium]